MSIMRGQFEDWAWREYGQILWWDMNHSDVFRRNGESYLTEFLSVRWEAWKASREAVIVPMPYVRSYPITEASSDVDYYMDEGRHEMKALCRQAIEAQGLQVKS